MNNPYVEPTRAKHTKAKARPPVPLDPDLEPEDLLCLMIGKLWQLNVESTCTCHQLVGKAGQCLLQAVKGRLHAAGNSCNSSTLTYALDSICASGSIWSLLSPL
jgi:hypothetical protein